MSNEIPFYFIQRRRHHLRWGEHTPVPVYIEWSYISDDFVQING